MRVLVLLSILIFCRSTTSAQFSRYIVYDLGVLSEGTGSAAYGLNNSGQVVGISYHATGSRAFLWDSRSGMRDLGILSGYQESFAAAINNNGHVTGWSSRPGHSLSFVWEPSSGLQSIGLLPGHETSIAHAINSLGIITGRSTGSSVLSAGFLREVNGDILDLGELYFGAGSQGMGINDNDVVVGHALAGSAAHAFRWTRAGGIEDLGVLTGTQNSYAVAINNNGEIVGHGSLSGQPLYWNSAGQIEALPVLAGSLWGEARAINDAGESVGFSYVGGYQAAIWNSSHQIANLNSLVDTPGWNLQVAYGINARGEIVGGGIINGQARAFLATPVPEPASLVLLGAGIILFWRKRKRK